MILFILVAAHFLADFTFQPSVLAKRKTENTGFLLLHSMVYIVITSIAGCATVEVKAMLLPEIIIGVCHFAFDWLRIKIDSRFRNSEVHFWSFIIDQVLHLAVICCVYFGFGLREYMLPWLENGLGIRIVRELVVCGLIFVIIWDPASVFVKKLFCYLSGITEVNDSEDEPRAGSLIGKLERLIIAFLVIFNQLSGIGFVLTAKSIARFKQFEEQGFAEKYLVGTLASTSIAIIVSLVLRMYI